LELIFRLIGTLLQRNSTPTDCVRSSNQFQQEPFGVTHGWASHKGDTGSDRPHSITAGWCRHPLWMAAVGRIEPFGGRDPNAAVARLGGYGRGRAISFCPV